MREPARWHPRQIGDEDLLERRAGGGGRVAIALDHQELMIVDRGHVADVRPVGLELVEPGLAGVALRRRVELADAEVLEDGAVDAVVAGHRPLEQRVEIAARRAHRHAFEAIRGAEVGREASEVRVERGHDLGAGGGGAGQHHVGEVNLAAKHLAARVGLDQEGPELLAEPEVAAAVEPDRLDVEVSARQEALGANRGIDGDGVVPVGVCELVGDQAEAEAVVWIAQADEAVGAEAGQLASRAKGHRCHRAGAAKASPSPDREVGLDRVDAQEGVGGVRLRAKAVVGHHVKRVVGGAGEHGGDALHGLLVQQGKGVPAGARAGELARRRPLGESVGGHHREAGELVGERGAAAEPRSRRGEGNAGGDATNSLKSHEVLLWLKACGIRRPGA